MKNKHFKKALSMFLSILMVFSCFAGMPVLIGHDHTHAEAATTDLKDKYLFAYFTGNSSDGQTVHLAVSEDGFHYTALRNNDPVIIPSKGTGAVRDPYIWYNEQDNYYYLIGTDMDATDWVWSDICNGFLMWRSKDLVHWYDETFINVYDMLQNFNEDIGTVHRAWAPQVMWDGQSYVIYFSLLTDGTYNNLSIVYFKATDLMDLSTYYEHGSIHAPGKYVNDADIIQNPTTKKWHLFYKTEYEPDGANIDIHMLVSDNATGPYSSPVSDSAGLDVFADVGEALEGSNGYFVGDQFVMLADAYMHDNGATAYFYAATTSAKGDFMSWETLGANSHNINTLSPRHGSVVQITEEEYNRLLNNAHNVTSSSYAATEDLDAHLVGRYFTTDDATYNAANGKNDLTVSGTIGMHKDYLPEQIGYYANFTGSNYAKINIKDLMPEGFNFDDGFAITFTALLRGNANSRFFSIANGSVSTNFAVNGSSSGAYVVTNGDKIETTTRNLADGTLHDIIVSYANGNIIIYVDGELLLKRNRFSYSYTASDGKYSGTDVVMDEDWYNALSDGTLYIGALGDNSGCIVGGIADFCIYDCSMAYYDVVAIQNEQDIEAGLVTPQPLNTSSFGTAIPSFTHSSTSQMAGHAGTNFQNVIYSPQITGMPSGTDQQITGSGYTSSSAFYTTIKNTQVAVYYPKNTVLYYDGVNSPKMPVMFAGKTNTDNYKAYIQQVYPVVSQSDKSDNKLMTLTAKWKGWNEQSTYWEIVQPETTAAGHIGHNSSTSEAGPIHEGEKKGKVSYYCNTLQVNTNNLSFNSDGYQKINLTWQVNGYYQEWKYIFPKYQWGDAVTNNLATPAYSSNNIYVVNLKPLLDLKKTIPGDYNRIVTSEVACPATIENYKAIVEEIMNFDPQAFNYAGGVESAVKACYSTSQQLIEDYNKAVAEIENDGKHKSLTFLGREPSCAAPGLTEGSYCEYCGKIFAEQTTTEKLAHTFSAKFEENGEWYVQCSGCKLKLLVKQNEVRFENLFSLNRFFETRSFNGGTVHNATASIDFEKSILSIVNTAASGEGYTYGSHTNKNYANYSMAVEPNTTYVAEYYSTTEESLDVFVFYYDKDQKYIDLINKTTPYPQTNTPGIGVHALEFTTPANCKYIEFRFDSNTAGKKVAVADFGLYTKESYDTFAKENPYSRLGFNTGESIELYTPKRIGYEFLGWYTSSGMKVTNTDQLENSVTVYARWREVGNSVLYNGNLFSLTEYAKTNDYAMQSNVIDGHIWIDFKNATLNTLSARQGLGKANLTEAQQFDTYNTYGSYKIPVTAGQEYVYTSTVADKSAYQTYLFFYGASGGVNHPATGSSHISHGVNNAANGAVAQWYGNTLVIRFTAPEGATHISIRMGSTGKDAFTQTYSDIGLYTAADYDEFVNGGFMASQTYVPDGENVALATPERTGYTFANWSENRDGSGAAFTDTSSITADKTVYAKWNTIGYTLTYALAGGSMSEAETKTYTIKDTFTLPTPEKSGYDFLGWKVTAADGNWVENGVCNAGDTVTGMSGNVTLTAQWQINSYTVTFKMADGTTTSAEYNYGTTPTAPANTAAYNDAAGHHTFAWPTISAVTADVTYEEKEAVGEHTVVTDAAVAATCTTPGKTEGSHCSVCNIVLVAQTEIPALGHVDTNKDHVCDNGCGIVQGGECFDSATDNDHKCDYCGKVLEDCSDAENDGNHKCDICGADNVTDHVKGEEERENITDATCSAAGKYDSVFYCTECNAEMERTNDVTIEQKPHAWQDATYEWSADGKTCTATRVCANNAEHRETETVTATGVQNAAPTCEDKGSTIYTATFTVDWATEQTKDVVDIPAKGHTEGAAVTENNVPATCTAPGSYDTVIYCTVETCKAQISRVTTTVPATGHSYGEWTTTTAATCTADGSAKRECSKCDASETKVLDKLGHSFGATTEANAATCTEAGNKAYKQCTVCNLYFAENAETNATDGKADTSTFVIAQLAHSYTGAIKSDGNGKDATHSFKCVNGCNEYGAAVKHTWNDGVIDPDSTCITGGTKTYTCTVDGCGATYTEDVAAKGHTFVATTEAKAATCVATGNNAYKQCTVCNLYFAENAATDSKDGKADTSTFVIAQFAHSYTGAIKSDGNGKDATHSFKCVNGCNEYGAAVKHTWNDGVENPEADCENAGTMTYTCTAEGCGATYTETVNPDGHSFGNWVDEVPATCIMEGTKGHYECSVCHKYFDKDKTTVISDLKLEKDTANHTKLVKTDAVAATCTVAGNIDYWTCEGCKKIYSDAAATTEITAEDTIVKATGHSYTSKVTAPTCTEQGYTTYTCSCGDTYEDNYVAATGHTYGDWKLAANKQHSKTCSKCGDVVTETCTESAWIIDKPTTCQEAGSQYKHCTVCNGELERETIAKLDHRFDAAPVYDAETGKHVYTCTYVLSTNSIAYCTATKTEDCADSPDDTDCLCDLCGHLVAHNYGAATCDEPATCTVCGETTGDKLGHDFSVKGETVDYTCTTDGYTVYKCSRCDATENRDITNAAHRWETEYTVDTKASCEANGSKSYHCASCDIINADSVVSIEKREHNLVDTTVEKEPTCSATGTMNQKCDCAETAEYEACDYTTTRVMDKVADAHKWETEYTVDKKASCDEAGSKSYHCEYCDAINADSVVEIAKREHNLVDTTVAKAPTCSATGTMNQKCDHIGSDEYEACTYTTTRVIKAVGHKFSEITPANVATCVATGNNAYKSCSVCNKFFAADEEIFSVNAKDSATDFTTDINPDNHDLKTTAAKEPTCTEIGWDEYVTCQREGCGYTTYEELEAIDHAWNKTQSEANLTRPVKNDDGTWADGYYTYTCKNDATHKDEEPVARANYTDYDAAVVALCARLTDATLDETVVTEINTVLTENEVADNLIETEQEIVETAVANLQTEVTKVTTSYTITFVKADELKSELTYKYGTKASAIGTPENSTKSPDAQNHYSYAWPAVQLVTGNATYEEIETPIAHTFGDWTDLTAPTCTTKGEKQHTCTACDYVAKEAIPALNHIDEDNNGYCDRETCNELICDHVGQDTVLKNDKEATCTADGYTGDKHCAKCDVIVEYGEKIDKLGHMDENKDHACDNGCDVYQGTHSDGNKDHACDYGCTVAIGTCADADKDHTCDYGCGKEYGEHVDTDKDHACDYGCSENIGTCEDKDLDHACDYGCDNVFGTCEDKDFDHDCDYGCDKYFGAHVDENTDHVCDYGCSETIGTCADGDKDHTCDYGCGKEYGEHVDTDKDHACDYGCSETIGTCEDKDLDHDCDYGCEATFGTHEDTDFDHDCDYGCSENIGTCEDKDLDHACDYGCDKYFGAHVDENTDHVCDYGCKVAIGTCEDANKDHTCDYGCGQSYGKHEDTDNDHACEYGCSVAIGTCEDKNLDHACDYGCDKVYGTCEDTDHDHDCDYGCDKVFGTCEDKDHDHDCDYGCDKYFGTHADSATDKDHVCDYGCGAVLEECSDVTNDGDHNCDICDKENVTAHDYADATCTEAKTCKECGVTEGKELGHAYERTLQRPAKLADNTWSDGKYIYVCKNNSEHTYEEAVARATYTEYDNIVAVVEGRLNDKSLHPDTRAEIEKLYADNKVALNLIVSEQEAVDAAVAALSDGIAIYLNTYKVTFVVDDVIIDMQTVYYGAGATAPKAPEKEGFVFTGWNGDYTNIKADIALNATYREGELTLNIVDSDIKVAFGKTKQIAVDIYPENAQVELIFTSADPAIATVDSNGVVKGVKVGATTVTVSDRDGEVKDTVIVYVYRANEKHTAQFTASAYGTFVVNGYSIEESTFISIKAGQEFKFEFIPDNQYKMDDIVLIVNGQELSLGDDGYYTISCMNENIMILVTYAPGGIVEDVPNGSGTNTQTHSCWCHSANKLLQLLWKVLMIICKAFGIEQYHYCACGKAHW
ncbi:MAG: InlB B-repeat-containing protein [Clostridia bacterium]|nr:InlB B-repeat-containing protein [Clostridia bacterium]